MRQLAIQVLLIAGTLAIAWRLLISYGQKAQAVRRLGLLVFAAFAVWSILDPNVWTRLARLVGIGRGADLILYGLVVAFFGFVVTTFRRFRELETRYTRLARRIALDEVGPARPLSSPTAPTGPTATSITSPTGITSPTEPDAVAPGQVPSAEPSPPPAGPPASRPVTPIVKAADAD